ncbi:hypothetical protein FEAC_00570 [Ferrimicrobium acidiphilum DSM 19497]|uniref:Uncharacterized protein n=1 Tax=Ferrimicrobium acidiphilum DSM 19497 TaxID=1121877 RepID=A0A0D8FYY2_9ACTN|nr:hypothetical protein FEAC_00570 [Ferrimicrobium acidiphilum DSM 19497]
MSPDPRLPHPRRQPSPRVVSDDAAGARLGGGSRAIPRLWPTTLASEMLQCVPIELTVVKQPSVANGVESVGTRDHAQSVLSHAISARLHWYYRHLPHYELRRGARMSDFERFLNGRYEPGGVRYRWGCERK